MMAITRRHVSTGALAGAALLAARSRPALAQAVELVEVDVKSVAKGWRTSKLTGSDVLNDHHEEIGSIDDIIIDKEKVLFAVIEVGGFLGLGGYLVAVPFSSLQVGRHGRQNRPARRGQAQSREASRVRVRDHLTPTPVGLRGRSAPRCVGRPISKTRVAREAFDV